MSEKASEDDKNLLKIVEEFPKILKDKKGPMNTEPRENIPKILYKFV